MMSCNYSGFMPPDTVKYWTIVDVDWSNAKAQWAAAKPMNCEELLLEQVALIASASPGTTAFVYRNAIKALPWYTLVREKITDPSYSSWFLPFGSCAKNSSCHVPVCDRNYNPPLCTNLYHDQGQTPGYPRGDGDCTAPACDVGSVPVGGEHFRPTAPPEGRLLPQTLTPLLHPTHPHQPEYLFDFRNANVSVNGQTFAQWYIEEYMFGPTGLGNPNISGYYVDDDWSNGRPSEMDGHAVEDMGLAPADVQAITGVFPRARARLPALRTLT